MLLKPLGSDTGRLETVEIDYREIGLRRLIRHLKRLPGLTVTSFQSWILTDDYHLDFTFRGHRFELDSPFVHYWISRQPDCPDEVFEALLDHLRVLHIPRWRYWLLYRFTDYNPSSVSAHPNHMNKYIVEFIGTFFLVLTIGCTVLPGAQGVIAPIAIGTVLAVMIFAGGHISGGHFNPSVTLAVTVRGKCTPKDAVAYVIFQMIGAIAAAYTAMFLYPEAAAKFAEARMHAKAIAVGPAFLAEFLFTFALAWTVLNVATSKDTAGNSFYGWAIGSVVVVGAFSVGSISGGAFNPAVSIGAALVGLIQWGNIWIHLSADILGGLLAAIAFKTLSTADRE